ncbi:MAG: TonB-dependent receptor, partial [Methanococcaceae archaeon]
MGHMDMIFTNRIVALFRYAFILSLFCLFTGVVLAGTNGKIAGKVIDSQTKEPVFGANIIVEGTYLGAAADINGYFSVNNIPPGEYRVIVTALGYQKTTYQKVLVKIDLTTRLDVKLNPSTLNIDKEVVVTAEKPLVQKDLTSTSATITFGEISMMPVEDVGQIVNLQAGVVGGHFRGGRSNEVAYLIDGVTVTDAYNSGLSVQIENSSIRQMEVISGTFNAEYGQAMSGVVNIVTQEGSSKFEGSVSGYAGNYYTNHNDLFRNLDKPGRLASKNLQASFSGPTGIPNLSFFLTGRYFYDEGYLYGIRYYNTYDNIQNVNTQGSTGYIPQHTGDGAFVPMNPNEKKSFNGKLAYSLPGIKFSYSVFYDDNFNKYYDHYSSWTP